MSKELHFAYPAIVHLRPSPLKMFWLIFGSAAFSLIGILMIRSGHDEGWYGAIFFGACFVVGVVAAIPNASGLVLMKEGFSMRALFRTRYYGWGDVSEFGVFTISAGHTGKTMIGFRGPRAPRMMSRLSSFVSGGFTHSLPDTYGMKAEFLADILNAYRREALKNVQIDAEHPHE